MEVGMIEYCDDGEDTGRDEGYRVLEWVIGLPSGDDLTPLCQSLVLSFLGLGFSIVPERSRTVQDVNWARFLMQLHKRFVDVVAHLGVKNAVPKTIMQLLNVEGLTRENVASHLQNYRGYLKRIQGLSMEGPSSSDQLISSTPVPPQSFQEGGGANGVTGKLGIPLPVSVYGNHIGGMQGYSHGHDHYHHHGNESNPYKFGSRVTSPSVGGSGVNDKLMDLK